MTGLGQRPRFQDPEEEGPRPVFPSQAEFHFVRVEYTDLPEYHRFFGFASRGARAEGWWVVDWPDADDHFSQGVERLTRIATGDPRHMRFTDDRLFDYPWVYATQTGWWNLSDAETARLREYLLRGGFLVVDDFWGADQWEIFRQTMARVLPGRAIPDLTETDSVMHVLYDIQEKDRTFIPGTRHLRRGPGGTVRVYQPEGSTPTWRAMYDDSDAGPPNATCKGRADPSEGVSGCFRKLSRCPHTRRSKAGLYLPETPRRGGPQWLRPPIAPRGLRRTSRPCRYA
jgi:hypothetical protein